jgi:hypothetical protein
MKVLIFGDSNTHDYFKGSFDSHVESYPGLCINEELWFLFKIVLEEDEYDIIIVSIGTNDWGSNIPKYELEKRYNSIYEYLPKAIIVGPYGDVDTRLVETSDGIHYKSVKEIGEYIKWMKNL